MFVDEMVLISKIEKEMYNCRRREKRVIMYKREKKVLSGSEGKRHL
jgi:hypothetical protein